MAECWPYPPLNEIGERLSWLTQVDQRRDDESRWGYRSARQSFDMVFRFVTDRFLEARQLLLDNVAGEWLVPVWHDGTATAVTGGDVSIEATSSAEFYVGGQAIIWAGFDDFEIVEVTSIDDGSIGFTPAASSSRARAFFAPLRVALIRDGAKISRGARDTWEIKIAFETTDNPDLALLIERTEIEIAIPVSSSMTATSSTAGFSRLDVAAVNAKAILSHLERSGASHDVQVTLYSSSSSYLRRNACDADGYQDLRDFIDAATTSSGASYAAAMANSATFFNGGSSVRRLLFLIASEVGSSASSAVTIRSSIDRLEVFGIMLDDASTSSLDLVDNTGGARSIDDGNDDLFAAVILGLLGLEQFNATPLLDCGGAVLGSQSGQIMRATSYLDSGVGPVVPVVERSIVESIRSTTIRHKTREETWALKVLLHFIQGRSRPFLVADHSLEALAMTEATATIDGTLLADETNWIGTPIKLFDEVRIVQDATLDGGLVELAFDPVQDLPAGLILRILRRVRLYSDELLIEHNRAAGWATVTLEAGGFDGV